MSRKLDSIATTILLVLGLAAPAVPARGGDSDVDASVDAPRGAFSLSYQTMRVDGYLPKEGPTNRNAKVEGQSVLFQLDWRIGDRWTLNIGLPYIERRYVGNGRGHDPRPCAPGQTSGCLTVPHPEAEYLDDGANHGTWQDWSLGASYSRTIGSFEVEPFVILSVPSTDYSFFALAAAGQQIVKLEIGADLLKQLAFSNVYYRVGYSYEFWEHTLGIDPSKNKVRAEIGYFVSPRWTVRALTFGQYGKGRYESDVLSRTDETWYQHDRFLRHTYLHGGVGAAVRVGSAQWISLDAVTMLWGESVLRTRWAGTLKLSRSF